MAGHVGLEPANPSASYLIGIFVTTSPEVGASLAAETLRARAAAMRICSLRPRLRDTRFGAHHGGTQPTETGLGWLGILDWNRANPSASYLIGIS